MAAIIQPDKISPRMRGWISPSGQIFKGAWQSDHSSIANEIYEQYDEAYGIGWIRWFTDAHTIFLDWAQNAPHGSSGKDAEDVCRAICRRLAYPFEIVYTDMPGLRHWKGSLDTFIKYGTAAKQRAFESKQKYYMLPGMGKTSSQRRIVESYTPEQEAEQASWKSSPYKIPFPGKQKKRRLPAPTKELKAAPDPFDTKPINPPK